MSQQSLIVYTVPTHLRDQETSLDIVWIRDGVVCLGSRSADRCYRAVLAVQGPPEAFAPEVERLQPLLDGFASFLNALGQPSALPPATLQALVLAEPTDLGEYAARLENRAMALPPHLAREALADAAWARQAGPQLGLLARRYLLLDDTTDLIIIDRKHEYRALCEAMGGQFLRVAASSPHRINPFDLPPARPGRRGVGTAGPHPAGPRAVGCAARRARPPPGARRAWRAGPGDQGGLPAGRHY